MLLKIYVTINCQIKISERNEWECSNIFGVYQTKTKQANPTASSLPSSLSPSVFLVAVAGLSRRAGRAVAPPSQDLTLSRTYIIYQRVGPWHDLIPDPLCCSTTARAEALSRALLFLPATTSRAAAAPLPPAQALRRRQAPTRYAYPRPLTMRGTEHPPKP